MEKIQFVILNFESEMLINISGYSSLFLMKIYFNNIMPFNVRMMHIGLISP